MESLNPWLCFAFAWGDASCTRWDAGDEQVSDTSRVVVGDVAESGEDFFLAGSSTKREREGERRAELVRKSLFLGNGGSGEHREAVPIAVLELQDVRRIGSGALRCIME